jgi:uncharacterized protein (DUF433 family)
MVLETRYEHVVLNQEGVPLISGTTMKVVELVSAHLAHGWSAEELHFQFPYLALGQIYSALAYYWDHREDFDREIERQLGSANELQRSIGITPLAQRLKAKGLI